MSALSFARRFLHKHPSLGRVKFVKTQGKLMQIINRLRGFISRQYDTIKFVEDWEKTNKVICVAGRIELTKFKRILDSWFFALWIASASIPLFGLIDLTNNPLATGVCLTWFLLSPLYASLTIYKHAAKLSLDETQEFFEDPENHFLKKRYFTRYWSPRYLAYDGGIEAFREERLLWAGERFKLKPKKITDKASSTATCVRLVAVGKCTGHLCLINLERLSAI